MSIIIIIIIVPMNSQMMCFSNFRFNRIVCIESTHYSISAGSCCVVRQINTMIVIVVAVIIVCRSWKLFGEANQFQSPLKTYKERTTNGNYSHSLCRISIHCTPIDDIINKSHDWLPCPKELELPVPQLTSARST